MTITFVGHGYVGLVTAAVFADLGNNVWVVGRTKKKIDNLNNGIMPFFEPGLKETVERNVSAGRMKFTLDYQEAVSKSQVVFIAVGTPSQKTGEADLTSVYQAAEKIGKNLNSYTVVVIKSTVPPGTNRKVKKIIDQVKPRKAVFDIASCPEFLREGSALGDSMHPDRVIIGAESTKAQKILTDLHKPIDGKIVVCGIETAEMIKYASNSLLSTKISFANAMAFLCERVGADVEEVLEGVGYDKRLGRDFLFPGVGYGGSCFPKDVKALIAIADKVGYDFKLLKSVNEINNQAAEFFIEKIKTALKTLTNKKIGILGLAFKPNTDDMREAASLKIIPILKKMGAKISAYDPVAEANSKKLLPGIDYQKNAYDAARDCDAIVILTEWNEFRQLDLLKLKKVMKQAIIFDGRNIYEPNKTKHLGFTYYGVGRS